MRIVAGAWRGRPIEAPPGSATRPTSDRAREGLFSMLQSRLGSFEGLEVTDLFAGTGALGLEALSRGAAFCTFVEKDRQAQAVLARNIERLGASGRAALLGQSVEHAPPPRRPADLIFLDPPYEAPLPEGLLARITAPEWLAPGGWISLERAAPDLAPPPGLGIEAERRFGKAAILLLRRAQG